MSPFQSTPARVDPAQDLSDDEDGEELQRNSNAVSSSEIVDISSDSDDELNIAKQKPRPKASSPTASSGQPSRPPSPYASSPLPASDALPLSTATTHQPPDDDDFMPPIVTLTTSVVSSPSVCVSKTQKLTIKLKPPKPPSSDRLDGFDELDDRGGGMAPPRLPTGAFPVDPGLSSSSAGVAVLFALANLTEN
ncbi:hypothetical protein B0H14DRAFT_3529362 [Mycena olivaceomarginata]|nr:hypothetical protein B0H14DRAFT_3529362 [Mycena olivaceomarginata]